MYLASSIIAFGKHTILYDDYLWKRFHKKGKQVIGCRVGFLGGFGFGIVVVDGDLGLDYGGFGSGTEVA
jgi:hypothetical protein